MTVPLASQDKIKGLLTAYYRRLAGGEKPVAWCSSVGPAELLRAFGFEVYFPENQAALIGARRLAGEFIPLAIQAGFSADICSYLTADTGAFLAGQTALSAYGLNQVPKPQVLVFNTNQCREVKEWFLFYGEKFHVPVIGLQTPQNIDDLSPALLDYLVSAWQGLIARLETISGTTFDPRRYREVLSLSAEASRLWQAFLDSNRQIPARHSFFDHLILMAPAVVLRGTDEAVAFYRQLLAEVEGIPATKNETRYRFYWEGMPIWGKMRFLSEFFAGRRISIVASTYCQSWAFDFDPALALPSTARAYAGIFITRSQAFKLRYLEDMIERFSVDAVLFHDAKTCPYNTNSRFGLPGKLRDIPCLTFYGDLVDLRHFSEQEFTLRLEAFIEQLH